ncbi:LysR family transcriptional regulator [Acetobacter estunensis]|uniref:LysR family transcriptional regulator n=1 Tax=Acetobacter estunensis TaxID=104097 RepID=UPI001C2DBDFB|nr:LysR family transcriptional regulator [Acetobacter estunensis]MBV1836727.1 LysR family transcriptional regulator [Acetobacter estunensis]
MKRGMDWRDLQFFLAVARAGSLSVAARALGVDHATVGRRVQSLEQATGLTLFERHLRGYALTRQGERLLAVAEAMEREAGRVAENVEGGLSGTVRISALEGFANFFLAPRIGILTQAHPDLTVEMVTIQQIVSLSRRQADLAVAPTPPTGDRFVAEPLIDYRLFIYASPTYLAAHPPIDAPEDLGAHRFAGYVDELLFTPELDYLGSLGISPRSVRIQNSSIQAQMAAVAAGLCLGVLPAFVAATQPGLARVLPHTMTLQRRYWLITRADDGHTARLRQLASILRREVEANRALFLPSPDETSSE